MRDRESTDVIIKMADKELQMKNAKERQENFENFIKEQADCNMDRLDQAIYQGMQRAKAEAWDKKKSIRIALSSAAIILISIMLGTNEQLHQYINTYYNPHSVVNETNSKMLQEYLKNNSKIIFEYLK